MLMNYKRKQKFKNIAILTSQKSWFIPFAKKLVITFKKKRYNSKLFHDHKKINNYYEIVFILSYFKIIEKEYLKKHLYNLVVHESSLPNGKGWAPLFWQILEEKNNIPIVLFEATEKMDSGKIYLKDDIKFEGHELYNEIRKLQAKKTIELCLKFLKEYNELTPQKQEGSPSYYKKRTQKDSQLDINKTIKDQFNLLRIVNNKEFPAFFYHKGHKYCLKTTKEKVNS